MNGAEDISFKVPKSSPRRQKKKLTLQDDFFSHSDQPRPKRKKGRSKHGQDAIDGIKTDDVVSTSDVVLSSSFNSEKDGLELTSEILPSELKLQSEIEILKEDRQTEEIQSPEVDDNNGASFEVSSEESDIEQFLRSTSLDVTDKDGYDFSHKKEKKRKYIIHVKSKLPIPDTAPPGSPTEAKFLVNGTKLFDRILELIILHFNKIYHMADSNERIRVEHALLVWVNGRMEVKPFFKPSTLRIPLPSDVIDFEDPASFPPTEFECLLIPIEHNKDFLEFYLEFNNGFRYRNDDDEDNDNDLMVGSDNKTTIDVDDNEDDVQILEVIEEVHQESIPEEVPEVFVIGLKGADNKRVECQVSKSTPFRHILDHYIKIKGLQNVNYGKVKMIFDDEQIDLGTLVGETELEEDFEVQIVL